MDVLACDDGCHLGSAIGADLIDFLFNTLLVSIWAGHNESYHAITMPLPDGTIVVG